MRKLRVLLAGLTLLVTGVYGNLGAGPYQTMLFWYAYRMDLKMNGLTNLIVAPGCPGSAPGGSCYFDEFIKYIQSVGKNGTPWNGKTSVGTNLLPDVSSTAQELSDLKYNMVHDPNRLLPGSFAKGVNTNFATIFNRVLNSIQASRQKVPNWQDLASRDLPIYDEVNEARQAMSMISDARKADQAEALIKGVNQALVYYGYNVPVQTKTIQAQSAGSYEIIDTDATLQKNGIAAGDQMEQAITQYVTGFDSTTPDAQRHATAVYTAQQCESRLFGDPGC